jgi:TfoX/Sxy family transcriptional regulator of competence genes
MAKKKVEIPQDKLEAYDRLIAARPEIKRKGVTSPYTSIDGHMFTYLSKTGSLGLRMSKEDREAFREKYDSPPFEQYGAIMREYVTVPDELLQNTAELLPYLEKSYAYAKTLKPKPGKKKS